MRLAIFDVDGTLTDTNEVDALCFRLAVKKQIGAEISCDWESYNHSTDAGIATEILKSCLKREPLSSELERAQTIFLEFLKNAYDSDPGSFHEIPGATNILLHLDQDFDWKIAIATGCWQKSALFKLQAAGVPFDCPFASCEDSVFREQIVQSAIKKAKSYYEIDNFDSIVYVGDGVWDVKAAQDLAIGFVGIGSSQKSERLMSAGAKFICPDFLSIPIFMNYLRGLKPATPDAG